MLNLPRAVHSIHPRMPNRKMRGMKINPKYVRIDLAYTMHFTPQLLRTSLCLYAQHLTTSYVWTTETAVFESFRIHVVRRQPIGAD